MKVAIVNGPNINMQGFREEKYYGTMTYDQLVHGVKDYAKTNKITMTWFQSNHEGELIDFLQGCKDKAYDGIIINAAAYSHTSIALLDTLLALNLPTIEVHLSDINNRENYRKVSYLRHACFALYHGEGILSYFKALNELKRKIEDDSDSTENLK